MVDLLIPSATEMRVGLLQATIRGVLGPGCYLPHVRTDLDPWLVAVIFPGQSQAPTASITPEQAADPRYRRVLAIELRNKARALGWLEAD
jgi:hypothetical protein